MPPGAEHRGGGTLLAPRHQTSVGGFSSYSQSRSWPPRPAPRAAGPPAGSPCLRCGVASTRPLCAACTKDGRPRSHSCFREVLSLAWPLGARPHGRMVEMPCLLWSCGFLSLACVVEHPPGQGPFLPKTHPHNALSACRLHCHGLGAGHRVDGRHEYANVYRRSSLEDRAPNDLRPLGPGGSVTLR